uniref:Uncharacterized protein n=1 Tax=Timema douglasi TaxID=61478 RepID=A0A7R8VFB4_TIMDO|nr:unnamed protein product [Timema douglasi]
MKEVVLSISHSLLISSNIMKPKSGNWAVTIDLIQETTITSLSNSNNVNGESDLPAPMSVFVPQSAVMLMATLSVSEPRELRSARMRSRNR